MSTDSNDHDQRDASTATVTVGNLRWLLPWLTAFVIVVLDRITKLLVMKNIEYLNPETWIELCPGLTLTHVRNRGIAFSLFSEGGPVSRVILHLVIGLAVVMITWMLVSHAKRGRLPAMAFGLILGGAVGNLLDRIYHGWVIDFIHVWVRLGDRVHSWPDFNIADSAITTGACLLILYELISYRQKAEHASDSD